MSDESAPQTGNENSSGKANEHERVRYGDSGAAPLFDQLRYDGAAFEEGVKVAEAFPDWNVAVTMGPHRGYDVHYEVYADAREIHLDYYSVRPGLQRTPDIIREIKSGLAEHADDV